MIDNDKLQDAIFRARKALGEVISCNSGLSELAETEYRALLVAKIVLQRGYLNRLMSALDDAARLADPKWYPTNEAKK